MSALRKRIRIGELLLEQKLISPDQLADALEAQRQGGGMLGHILMEMGFVEETQMLKVLSEQLLLPVIDLRQYLFVPEVVRLLPEAHARRHRAIVLRSDDDGLVVGMVDPTDIIAYDNLARVLKRPIKQAIVRESEVLQAIDTVYRRTEEIVTLAEELGEEMAEGQFDIAQLTEGSGTAEDAPVVRLLQSLFEDAVQVKASDIHIEPEEHLIRVRQRIDGFLHEQIIEETRIASAMVTRLKLMSGLDIAEKRLPQDGRFQIKVKDNRIDIRLSTMPVAQGESIVMRLLDQSAGLLNLEQLGIPDDTRKRLERLVKRPNGMVLVTGPTGSGKTTTLYAAINKVNAPEAKIITVEDPIEYRLPRINQVQVNSRIDLTFARVLRAALRQDPDVILVGEMRDPETAEIGVRAAMTGHLVLSTLHTNDSISTVNRMIDMGVASYMVATALNAVVAQRLVRRVCENCAASYSPTPGETAWVHAMMGPTQREGSYRHGTGCQYCNNTGYRGRVGLYELLELDTNLAELLRSDRNTEFEHAAARQPGFRPLAQSGLDAALRGHTTISEVIRVAGSLEDMPAYVRESGARLASNVVA